MSRSSSLACSLTAVGTLPAPRQPGGARRAATGGLRLAGLGCPPTGFGSASRGSRSHMRLAAGRRPGRRPAHTSERSPQQQLVDAAFRGDLNQVSQLLDSGQVAVNPTQPAEARLPWWLPHTFPGPLTAGPNTHDSDWSVTEPLHPPSAETSPLVAAAARGHADVVKVLLERGANVLQAVSPDSIQGVVALCAAAVGGHTDVVRLLLSHSISANVSLSVNGDTCFILPAGRAGGMCASC